MSGKYNLYISLGLNAMALQFIWIYHVPPWLKTVFLPVTAVEDDRFGGRDRARDDLRSLTSVYDHLNRAILLESGNRKVSHLGIPLHRLQLALAMYIVTTNNNQDSGLFGRHHRKRNDFVDYFIGVEKANVSELVELRDRAYLVDWGHLTSKTDLDSYLRGKGYVLLRHGAVPPGTLDHFLAFHPDKKEFIVSVHGSSSVVDSMKNLMGVAKDFELPNNPYSGENSTYTIHAHKGMMNAALHVLNEVMPIVEYLILPTDFKIIVHGHSLGGGCAALLGMALRAYLPTHRDRIQVYAFAPAAVLDQSNAIACREFVTSVINRADVVPRISFVAARIMVNVLARIDQKLQVLKLAPTVNNPIRTTKRIQKLLSTEKAPFFATWDELEDMIRDASEKVGARNVDESATTNLLAPGRMIVLYELERDHTYTATGSFVADGSHPKVNFIQVERTLFSDHMTGAYIQSLDEAIQGQSSDKPIIAPKAMLGRLSMFFTVKLQYMEDCFSPTTRLDSPFVALIIATLILCKVLSSSVLARGDQPKEQNTNETQTDKKIQSMCIKKKF